MRRALLVLGCLTVAACDNYIVMYDPASKQTADCHKTFIDSINPLEAADSCARAYEALGYVRSSGTINRN